VADSDTQTENLLQLELDLRLEFLNLGLDVIVVSESGGEFTSLVQTRSKETGDLRNQGLRGEEGVELAGQLFDELGVLVQLLEVVNSSEGDSKFLSLLAMTSITENANLHSGSGDVGELDGTSETLVSLGIVVLEADLKFDGLDELSGLLLSTLQNSLDSLLQIVDVKLASHVVNY